MHGTIAAPAAKDKFDLFIIQRLLQVSQPLTDGAGIIAMLTARMACEGHLQSP